MSSWLWKCKKSAEKWMRKLERRQYNNYRWLKNWRKKSISFLWSQYFNQALFFQRSDYSWFRNYYTYFQWFFLILKLSENIIQRLSHCQKFRSFNLELQKCDFMNSKKSSTVQECDFLHKLCHQSCLIFTSQRKKHLLKYNQQHSISQKQLFDNWDFERDSKTANARRNQTF